MIDRLQMFAQTENLQLKETYWLFVRVSEKHSRLEIFLTVFSGRYSTYCGLWRLYFWTRSHSAYRKQKRLCAAMMPCMINEFTGLEIELETILCVRV